MEKQGFSPDASAKVREISWGEIFTALFRWWWVVALWLILVPLLAYYYTLCTYVPVYSASMVINSRQPKFYGDGAVLTNDVELSAKLVNTYTAILTSNRVMELVIQELQLDLLPGVLKPYVAVEPVKDTEVLNVQVNYPVPEISALVCNAIINVAPAAISSTIEVGSVNVLDYSQVPEDHKHQVLYRSVGAGTLLGLLLGLATVFLLLWLDNTIKHGDDVKNKLGLVLLGSIPFWGREAGQGACLVTSEQAGFGFLEAYKSAGTNFRFAAAANHAKKLLVTGTLTGEGKSTVAVNLALSVAQAGKSVLLVDCDLRKPNVHRVLGLALKDNRGLAAVLCGAAKAEDCMVYLAWPGIHVLPNETIVPNPSELLGSVQMSVLLTALEQQFDYIILDTPPAYLLTDALTLAVHTDGVLLVVKQGYAQADLINLTRAGFAQAGVPVLGCILNGIKYSTLGPGQPYRYNERYLGKYYHDYVRVNAAAAGHNEADKALSWELLEVN